MLFRNTSAPSNPFSTQSSLTTSIISKGFRKSPDQFYTNSYNLTRKSPSKSKYQNQYWNTRQETNINDIKQDNPFQKYSNLQDLVRQGITQKHEYQRSRKQSFSPFKTNYQYSSYKPESSKYINTYNGSGYNDYKQYSSSSYIPSSYTPAYQKSNGYSDYGGSYYGSSSYIPPVSTYVPLIPESSSYEPIYIEAPLQKKVSKFKPIDSNLNSSNHYSFEIEKKKSDGESISQYFPLHQQKMVKQNNLNQQQLRASRASQASQSLKNSKQLRGSVAMQNSGVFDPFNDKIQKNDSIMSYTSQRQNNSMFKNSLNKKASIHSNDFRFSSADQRQTFGKSKHQQKQSISDDPFEEFNKNNRNFAYQSFVQQQNQWPQFIQLSNTKFYYKPLKAKTREN